MGGGASTKPSHRLEKTAPVFLWQMRSVAMIRKHTSNCVVKHEQVALQFFWCKQGIKTEPTFKHLIYILRNMLH